MRNLRVRRVGTNARKREGGEGGGGRKTGSRTERERKKEKETGGMHKSLGNNVFCVFLGGIFPVRGT